MKKLITFIAYVFISIQLFAQAPQKMSYQAVIRNASNNLVTNAPVKMKISILQGSATGTSVYSELHSATTNANGLATIEIGAGTSPQGTFSSINWGNGTYYLKTETDPTNGTNYSIVGTSQLLSVPYALESRNSSSAGDGVKGVSNDTLTLNNGEKYIIPGIKKIGDIPPNINNGLIAYYPFNGNANDESGNGKNGTVKGASLTTDRNNIQNKAYFFSGTDYIELPSVMGFENINNLSISFWIKSASNLGGGIVFNQWLTGSGGSGANIGIQISCNYSGTVSICQLGGCPGGVSFNTNQILDTWKFITLIFNGNLSSNSRWKCYMNGQLFAESGNSQVPTTIGTSSPRLTLIGASSGFVGGPITSYYKGQIDDLRIYNRVLTQEEITYLSNN